MLVKIDAISNVGCVREHNEDIVLVQGEFIRDARLQLQVEPMDGMPLVVAVADGMGGHNGGEFASELAVGSLDEFVHALPSDLSDNDLRNEFDKWIQDIHSLVLNKGKSIPEFYNMGTTLVGILIYENSVFWFNVGDSRLYRYRDGILSQMSTDHSARNMIDPKAASNLICNSIGAGDEVFIDFLEMNAVFEDDVFVLCSDGLNDMIADAEIEKILENNGNSEDLVNAAKAMGGRDNVSVVKICFNDIIEPIEDIVSSEESTKDDVLTGRVKDIEIPEIEENDTISEDKPYAHRFVRKDEAKEKSIIDKLGSLFKKG
jgi:protein phosphatase